MYCATFGLPYTTSVIFIKLEKKKFTRPAVIGGAVPRVCPGSEREGQMCVCSAGISR